MKAGRVTAAQGNPELAQYFTPRPVAEFMWQGVQLYAGGAIGPGARIIDPSAGKGDLLAAVLDHGPAGTSEACGIEIDPALRDHVVEGAGEARWFTGDALLDEFTGVEPGSFDVVVGNPPFGRVGDFYPASTEASLGERFVVWRAGKERRSDLSRGPRSFAIELLFLERALQLARPGGVIAFVVPEGVLTNARLQAARDFVLRQARLLASVSLPTAVFSGPGLHATTAIVFLRRRPADPRPAALADSSRADGEPAMTDSLGRALEELRAVHRGRAPAGCLSVAATRLPGSRWDSRFWRGREKVLKLGRRFRLALLGDFIERLTYGPIVTGERPEHADHGIPVIRQGDFTETGLHLDSCLRVQRNGRHDPERSRVARRDLLLPRSGAGALGRNRVAVYLGEGPANVGCFVDLVRLAGLSPFYAWLFLRSQPGWQQIRSLINGVGTPNISFPEIRSLRIPAIGPEEQRLLETRYEEEVWPLHRRRSESPQIREQAERRFGRIVTDLEGFLDGSRASVG